MKRLWKSRKALSPVVAAIILIAVTVAVSIAVAAWMGALTFTWMGYEGVEITSVTWSGDNTALDITISNTGTKALTVNHFEINYIGIASTDASPNTPFPLDVDAVDIAVTLTYGYVNGTAYDISVVTSSGYEFTDHFTGGQDTPG